MSMNYPLSMTNPYYDYTNPIDSSLGRTSQMTQLVREKSDNNRNGGQYSEDGQPSLSKRRSQVSQRSYPNYLGDYKQQQLWNGYHNISGNNVIPSIEISERIPNPASIKPNQQGPLMMELQAHNTMTVSRRMDSRRMDRRNQQYNNGIQNSIKGVGNNSPIVNSNNHNSTINYRRLHECSPVVSKLNRSKSNGTLVQQYKAEMQYPNANDHTMEPHKIIQPNSLYFAQNSQWMPKLKLNELKAKHQKDRQRTQSAQTRRSKHSQHTNPSQISLQNQLKITNNNYNNNNNTTPTTNQVPNNSNRHTFRQPKTYYTKETHNLPVMKLEQLHRRRSHSKSRGKSRGKSRDSKNRVVVEGGQSSDGGNNIVPLDRMHSDTIIDSTIINTSHKNIAIKKYRSNSPQSGKSPKKSPRLSKDIKNKIITFGTNQVHYFDNNAEGGGKQVKQVENGLKREGGIKQNGQIMEKREIKGVQNNNSNEKKNINENNNNISPNLINSSENVKQNNNQINGSHNNSFISQIKIINTPNNINNTNNINSQNETNSNSNNKQMTENSPTKPLAIKKLASESSIIHSMFKNSPNLFDSERHIQSNQSNQSNQNSGSIKQYSMNSNNNNSFSNNNNNNNGIISNNNNDIISNNNNDIISNNNNDIISNNNNDILSHNNNSTNNNISSINNNIQYNSQNGIIQLTPNQYENMLQTFNPSINNNISNNYNTHHAITLSQEEQKRFSITAEIQKKLEQFLSGKSNLNLNNSQNLNNNSNLNNSLNQNQNENTIINQTQTNSTQNTYNFIYTSLSNVRNDTNNQTEINESPSQKYYIVSSLKNGFEGVPISESTPNSVNSTPQKPISERPPRNDYPSTSRSKQIEAKLQQIEGAHQPYNAISRVQQSVVQNSHFGQYQEDESLLAANMTLELNLNYDYYTIFQNTMGQRCQTQTIIPSHEQQSDSSISL